MEKELGKIYAGFFLHDENLELIKKKFSKQRRMNRFLLLAVIYQLVSTACYESKLSKMQADVKELRRALEEGDIEKEDA